MNVSTPLSIRKSPSINHQINEGRISPSSTELLKINRSVPQCATPRSINIEDSPNSGKTEYYYHTKRPPSLKLSNISLRSLSDPSTNPRTDSYTYEIKPSWTTREYQPTSVAPIIHSNSVSCNGVCQSQGRVENRQATPCNHYFHPQKLVLDQVVTDNLNSIIHCIYNPSRRFSIAGVRSRLKNKFNKHI